MQAAAMQMDVSTFCILTAVFLATVYFRPGETLEETCTVVRTKQGLIQGRRIENQDTGLKYEEYLGIRYAQTPKRFERAQYPPSRWSGIFRAKEYRSQCPWVYSGFPWLNTSLSEDCLFLNVYVPKGGKSIRRRLPVLVLIHPGGFEFGNANSFNHGAWTSRGMIVVSMAYRLGVFGWATTANSLLPGNLGLWDQNAALRWTHDNIASFGGDQHRITITGQSCGGVSVISHLLSPKSRGLFRRVMAISGSALATWGNRIPCDKETQYARWIRNFARSLNCSCYSDKENIMCLRDASMQDLLKVSNIAENLEYRSPEDRWAPVVDGELIPAPPKTLYKHLLDSKIDLMVGSGYRDARSFALEDYKEPRPNVNSPADFFKWRFDMTYHLGDLVRQKVFQHYGLNSSTDPTSESYTEMLTHETYAAAQELDATLHARSGYGRTYSFIWRHRPSFSQYEDWVEGEHREFLYFWLGLVGKYAKILNPTPDELRHEQDLLDYQANFIANGNPNLGHQVPATWPCYKGTSSSRYVIEFRVPTAKSKFINKYWGNNAKFWAHLWEKSYGNQELMCPYAQCDKDIEN